MPIYQLSKSKPVFHDQPENDIFLKKFNFDIVHASWMPCLTAALKKLDPYYLKALYTSHTWLPGHEKIFSAFSLPVSKTRYILFGESPYPREKSANGYAFWDNAVTQLWSETGLSKMVNRATSLRNIIKMLLVAEGALKLKHTTQLDIAHLDKTSFAQTNPELFRNFLQHGFLLLNATPVLRPKQVKKDAIAWQPFIKHILDFIFETHPSTQLILFGSIANTIDKLVNHHHFKKLYAEHPYNISFIENPDVIAFFQPLHLLRKPRT